MTLLSWLLVSLAGLSLAVMVVSLIIAARSVREIRATIFPIVREEESARLRRARIVASVTGVIAATMAGAFFFSGQLPMPMVVTRALPEPVSPEAVAVVESPTPDATIPATVAEVDVPAETEPSPENQIEEPSPTSTEVPQVAVPSPTTTPTQSLPTSTATVAPSATSTPIPPSPTPAGTPVPAPGGADMGPIAFAAQVTERREPIDPTDVFSDTVSRVYAVFPYRGMRNGLSWTQVWYFNDVEFSRGDGTWEWGSTDRSYVFTKLVGVGNYRLELYVNDSLLTTAEFDVQGPAAMGGPESP